MAVEPLWSAKEFQSLGNAILELEETLQEWEVTHGLKVTDLMLNIGSQGRDRKPLGLISMHNMADTELQFEALDASITIA